MKAKKIIGIVSCKGGVGKSTLAVNLSVLLSSFYFKRVGLLDADIHGPNHPRFLGSSNDLKINIQNKSLIPKKKYNVMSMSMGYFLGQRSSALLRGPMVSNTLNYLYTNTQWDMLDVLIIDFPPGTGDVYLSMLRDIKFDGVFLVTTPQTVSIEDVKRSIFMLNKFNVNILGILENKKYYECNTCGSYNYIYGYSDNFKKLVSEFKISNVYGLPLHMDISKSSNTGIPFIFYESCYQHTLVLNKICQVFL